MGREQQKAAARKPQGKRTRDSASKLAATAKLRRFETASEDPAFFQRTPHAPREENVTRSVTSK
jgi:hypothetical protein